MSTKKLQILDNIITTDTSLTQSGFAADAKAVGDIVFNLETDVTSLLSQVLVDSFVMKDVVTGDLYKLQIQNGQLVSFSVTEE